MPELMTAWGGGDWGFGPWGAFGVHNAYGYPWRIRQMKARPQYLARSA